MTRAGDPHRGRPAAASRREVRPRAVGREAGGREAGSRAPVRGGPTGPLDRVAPGATTPARAMAADAAGTPRPVARTAAPTGIAPRGTGKMAGDCPKVTAMPDRDRVCASRAGGAVDPRVAARIGRQATREARCPVSVPGAGATPEGRGASPASAHVRRGPAARHRPAVGTVVRGHSSPPGRADPRPRGHARGRHPADPAAGHGRRTRERSSAVVAAGRVPGDRRPGPPGRRPDGARRCPMPSSSRPTRSSLPAVGRSRRRSPRGARLADCS